MMYFWLIPIVLTALLLIVLLYRAGTKRQPPTQAEAQGTDATKRGKYFNQP
jgi:hypothetical protein